LTGESLLTLPHVTWLNGALWSQNEARLLTWTQDGDAHVWLLDLDQLTQLSKTYPLRPLDNAERVDLFLPMLEPTVVPLSLPTITPLPTLTPSPVMPTITPLPTVTPFG
jgi:hypothetical protein